MSDKSLTPEQMAEAFATANLKEAMAARSVWLAIKSAWLAGRAGWAGFGAEPISSPLAVGTPVWWLVDLMPTASARTTVRRGRIVNDGPTCAVATGDGAVEFVDREWLMTAPPKEAT